MRGILPSLLVLAVAGLTARATTSCSAFDASEPGLADAGNPSDADPPSGEAGAGPDSGADARPAAAALELDGVDDYATLPPGSYLAGAFTFELWFRLRAVPTSTDQARAMTLLSLTSADTDCEDVYLGFGSGVAAATKLVFQVDATGGCPARDTNPLQYSPPGGWVKDRWYHVAAVREGGGATVLYVDAESVGARPTSGNLLATSLGVSIGRWPSQVPAELASFQGSIDELRLYNRALAFGEVAARWANGAGTYGHAESGLLAGYHFDGTGDAFTSGSPAVSLRGASFADGLVQPP